MNWRETERYLSIEYLDADTGELMDLIDAELPFERVRDGNVTAWVLRAEHDGVITAADRIQLLAKVRGARHNRELERGLTLMGFLQLKARQTAAAESEKCSRRVAQSVGMLDVDPITSWRRCGGCEG